MNKNNKILLTISFLLSLFLGITFIHLLNTPIQRNANGYLSREIVSRVHNERLELQHSEDRVDSLSKDYRKLQKKTILETDLLSEKEFEKYSELRTVLGQEYIIGEGVIITIASNDPDRNIAFLFDSDRILLKLVNLAKRKGGEVVAINNRLILHNTGIVLAGNHININNAPITPPYEIKIIGNEKTLERFFSQESVFMLSLDKKYEVTTTIVRSRKIEIPKTLLIKELEYIREEK